MKKWQYNHYDVASKSVPLSYEWKEPIVWAVTSPGVDYTDVTTPQDFFERELSQKSKREVYGITLFNNLSSKLRIERLQVAPTITDHAAARANSYSQFDILQESVRLGNFISAYEDVNNLTTGMGLTTAQITEYRAIVSTYLVSTGVYTDPFGNIVEGAMYDELAGLSLDSNYFIIEA